MSNNMTIRPLSKELQEKAKRELNEEPSRIEDDINHLRDWLAKQPHLNARTDDQWLLGFLRCCKFSIHRTKARLDFFYTLKTLTPEICANTDPMLPEIQDILTRGIIIPITKVVEPDGSVVIINQWNKADPQKNLYFDIFKVGLMFTAVMLMENDNFSVAGVQIINDFTDFGYFKQNTPSFCKKLVLCGQYAYPMRVKAFHLINAPPFCEVLYNLVKPFLSEKNKNKITIHGKGDLSSLYKHVPINILPKQYGGEGGCTDEIAVQWKKKIESYREWFLEESQYCSDESKRPGKPITSADLLGVEGSFRKLDID